VTITRSVDDEIAQRARATARAMGRNLNQLVEEYLEQLAGHAALDAELDELRLTSGHGNSNGRKFDRSETYAERLKR
jgi:antitoxin component of RelBE/YafQ-DinJ toxin-antitoxin module